MINKVSRATVRQKKHRRMRNNIAGTAERPRLAVFRSNNHMYAQIIDDSKGHTLLAASTLDKDVKANLEKTNDVAAASYLGSVIGRKPWMQALPKWYLTAAAISTRARLQHWQTRQEKPD